jgi:fructose-bisphosphate aldolase, class II
MGITVPVAIHADHYGIKNDKDLERPRSRSRACSMPASPRSPSTPRTMPDDQNLLANIASTQFIPDWAGLETEVGEIKGKEGLSTLDEALFLIQGLNAHDIFPDWIALNNGTTHGIEAATPASRSS